MATFFTGNTGRSTGPHLDFRVWDVEKGGYIDPMPFTSYLSSNGKGIDQFTLTSPYGADRGSYIHQGVDYATEIGTPINVNGTFLTTFNDAGGGITNQYAIERDGKQYELLLMHGSDANKILTDGARTDGKAVSAPVTPEPSVSDPNPGEQTVMSPAQVNAEYDRMRMAGDALGARNFGMEQHKRLFNKR